MSKQLNVNLAFTADVSQAQANIQALKTSLNQIATITPVNGTKLSADMQMAVNSAKQLQQHLGAALNMKTGNIDFKALEASLSNANTNLATLSAGLLKCGLQGEQAFMNIQRAIGTSAVKIAQADGLLTQFWTTLKNTARWQLSSSLLHGLVGAASSALGYAKDLDKSLNNIRIVTGYNVEHMANFAKEANKAAKALNTTTTAYTNASLIYYQQGLDDKAVKERTDITVKMANVTGQTAEKVSDQLTAIWNNFAKGGEQLESYVDIITALGAATASSTDEIATGLEKFAAVAETVGLSYEYATAALATVTATTRQSADVVGTAFKTLFARIQDLELGKTLDDGTTLGSYSEALNKVGVNIKDANGNLKDMNTILDEMGSKWQQIDKDQQVALAKSVAGIRQYTQLIALMDNWDFMEQNLNVANTADGTLQEQADIYAESWEGASKRVKAAAENIYNSLIPSDDLIDLTNGFADLLNHIGAVLEGMGGIKTLLLLISTIALTKMGPALTNSINQGLTNFQGFGHLLTKIWQGFDLTGKRAQQASMQIEQIGQNGLTSLNANISLFNQELKNTSNFSLQTLTAMNESALATKNLTDAFREYTLDTQTVYNLQSVILANKKYLTAAEMQQVEAQQQALLDAAARKQKEQEILEILQAEQDELIDNISIDRSSKQLTLNNNGASFAANLKLTKEEMNHLVAQHGQLFNDLDQIGMKWERTANTVSIVATNTNGAGSAIRNLNQKAQEASHHYKTILEVNQGLLSIQNQSTEEQHKYIANLHKANTITNAQAGMYHTLINKSQNLTADTKKLAESAKQVMQIFGVGADKIAAMGQKEEAILSQINRKNQAQQNYNNQLNIAVNTMTKMLNKTMSVGAILTNVMQTASSSAMALSSMSSWIKQIGDDSVSWVDKLVSGTMAISMSISALMNGFKLVSGIIPVLKMIANEERALAVAQMFTDAVTEKGIALDTLDIILTQKKSAARKKELATKLTEKLIESGIITQESAHLVLKKLMTAATEKEMIATAKSIAVDYAKVASEKAKMLAKLGWIGLVVGALAVLAYTTYKVATAESAAEKEYKQSSETLKSLKTELENAKQAAQDLQAAFDSYEDIRSKLDSCVYGTKEWTKALQENKSNVLELIEKYPELLTMVNAVGEKAFTVLADGSYQIADWATEQLLNDAYLRQTRLITATNYASMVNAKNKIIAEEVDPFVEDNLGKGIKKHKARGGGSRKRGGSSTEAGKFLSRLGNSSNLERLVGLSNEEDIIRELQNIAAEMGITLKSEDLTQLSANILTNSDELAKVANKLSVNNDQMETQNKLLAKELLKDNKDVQESEYKEHVESTVGGMLESYIEQEKQNLKDYDAGGISGGGWGKDGISQADGVNTEALKVWREYLEAAGMKESDASLIDTTGNDSNRVFVYADAGGNEHKVSLETMRTVKATYEANKKLNMAAGKLTQIFAKLEESNSLEDKAMSSFLKNKNFGEASLGEWEDLIKNISYNEENKTYDEASIKTHLDKAYGDGNGELTEEEAKALGYDSVEAMVNAFADGMKASKAAWDKLKPQLEEAGVDAAAVENLSLGAATNLTNTISKIKMGPLGEAAAQDYMAVFNKTIASVPEEKQAALANDLASINWNAWDAIDQYRALLQKYNIELSATSTEIQNFAAQMRTAMGAQPDFSKLVTDLQNVSSVLDELDFGSVINEEDYQTLIKYNEAWAQFFMLQADGSRKFFGNTLEMKSLLISNIEAGMAELQHNKSVATAFKNSVGNVDWNFDDKDADAFLGGDGKDGKINTTDTSYYKWLMSDERAGKFSDDTENGNITRTASDKYIAWAKGRYYSGESGREGGPTGFNILENKEAMQILAESGYSEERVKEVLEEAKAGDDAALDQMIGLISQYVGTDFEALNAQMEEMLASTAKTAEERLSLLQEGKIGEDAYLKAAHTAIAEEAWEGLDQAAVEEYASYLQSSLNLSEEQALETARAITKMNQGVEALSSNWEEWGNVLKDVGKQNSKVNKSSQEYAKAIQGTRKALSDVLDVSEDFIDIDFIETAENLELIEKVAKGDTKAIDQLNKALAKDIALDSIKEKRLTAEDLIDLGVSSQTEAISKVEGLLNEIDTLMKEKIPTLDLGQSLSGTDQLFQKMQQVVAASKMTVEEANAYYRTMGFTPTFKKKPMTASTVVPLTTTYHKRKVHTWEKGQPIEWTDTETSTTTEQPAGKRIVETLSMGVTTGDGQSVAPEVPSTEVESLTYTGGGSMTNTSTSSGGGGGGGSKKKTKDTEIERYHKINKTLEYLKSSYDAISKARERAFGQDKLNYLQQEQAILEQELEAQQQYLAEAEAFYQKDKEVLAGYGGEFNEQGILTNYDALMESYIEQFNTGKIDEEAYNAFKEAISKYETTWQTWIDQSAAVVDAENALLDKKLETVQAKVDLNISLSEDQMEWLEYQLENIEDAAYGAAEAFALLSQKATEIQNKANTNQTALTDFLNQRGITDINDESQWENAKLTEAEIEWLRSQKTELLNTNKELQQLKQEAIDQAISAYDEWNTKIDENIKKFKHYSSIVESFKNIIDIVGKDTLGIANETLAALTQAEVDNATNKLTSAKEKLDASKQAESEILSKMIGLDKDSEEYKILEQTLKHIQEQTTAAEEEMMSNWEEALQSAADAFEQAVERSISIFEKAMAGTYGSLEELQKAFEQSNKVSERYVEDYKKIYELSKLNRDVMKSIDETDNVKAKQALRDLQKEINNLQNSNTKMSQYELDHARKKYELRLAEIALEEAQNAKSQVRMRRDSEGNYSYVFTADQNAIDEAQQNYEDKLYEMQELNTKYIKEMQNNILQSEIELTNALRELDRTKFASDAEYYAKVNELTNYYTGQRNYALEEANKGILNNKELVDQDWANYSAATGYKISADADFVDSFDETTYAQLAGYTTIEEAQTRFVEASTMMITDLNTAFTQWQTDLDRIMSAAGSSVAGFGDQMNTTVYGDEENDGIIDASNMAKASVKSLADQMLETFSTKTLSSLSDFAKNYQAKIRPVIETNEALVNTLNEFIARQAAMNTRSSVYTGVEIPSTSTDGDKEPKKSPQPPAGEDDICPICKKPLSQCKGHSGPLSEIEKIQEGLGVTRTGVWDSATQEAAKALFGTDSLAEILMQLDSIAALQNATVPKQEIKKYGGMGGGGGKKLVNQMFDTGGYTGDWGNNEGRLAVLHKKELILNPEDTENMLSTIELVRNIARIIDLNAGVQSLGLGYLSASSGMDNSQVLEQQVTIHAEFPEAQDRNEIKEAFSMLINEASQFANRKNL